MDGPRWPELMHPFASATDTPLPAPPEVVLIMEDYRPAWTQEPTTTDRETHFGECPEESIQSWHEKRRLLEEVD